MTPDSAAVAAMRPDVVRGLEWHARAGSKEEYADTDVGRYEVGIVHGGYIATRRYINEGQWEDDVFSFGNCAKRDAKAAAQADYAARILSALSPAFIERIGALERENAELRGEMDKLWRMFVVQCESIEDRVKPNIGDFPAFHSAARTAIQEPTKAEDGERQGDEG